MRQNSVSIAVLVVLSLSLGGCMMAMHGGGHTAARREGNRSVALAKGEVADTAVDVSVSENENQAAAVAVTVAQGTSRIPVQTARVSIRVRPVASAQGAPHHSTETNAGSVELDVIAVTDRPGVYEARHTFQSAGPHEIQIALHAPEQGAADLLVLTATYDARAAEHHPRRLTPLIVVGGIAMAAVMVVRLLVF